MGTDEEQEDLARNRQAEEFSLAQMSGIALMVWLY